MSRLTALLAALASVLAIVSFGASAAAADELPPCGTITTAFATLTHDCAAPLVIAKTGARVNLGGHTVTCTAPWDADYEEWDAFADPRIGIAITNRRSVRVSNGSVVGCGKGIYITGGRSHVISGMRVLENGGGDGTGAWGTGAGIVIAGGAHNLVTGSTVSDNGGPGIVLWGDRNRVVGNTLRFNIGGILASGFRNYVDGNTVGNTTGEYDPAIDAGPSTVVRWNRVDRTYWAETGTGIRAHANSVVRGNHVTRSGGSGIWVGSGATVAGNTVTGNGTAGWTGCGIEIAGTGALVAENTVTSNGEVGSAVAGICATSAGNRIRLNVTGSNGDVDIRDDSGSCTANLWQGNAFATRFPDCIG